MRATASKPASMSTESGRLLYAFSTSRSSGWLMSSTWLRDTSFSSSRYWLVLDMSRSCGGHRQHTANQAPYVASAACFIPTPQTIRGSAVRPRRVPLVTAATAFAGSDKPACSLDARSWRANWLLVVPAIQRRPPIAWQMRYSVDEVSSARPAGNGLCSIRMEPGWSPRSSDSTDRERGSKDQGSSLLPSSMRGDSDSPSVASVRRRLRSRLNVDEWNQIQEKETISAGTVNCCKILKQTEMSVRKLSRDALASSCGQRCGAVDKAE